MQYFFIPILCNTFFMVGFLLSWILFVSIDFIYIFCLFKSCLQNLNWQKDTET